MGEKREPDPATIYLGEMKKIQDDVMYFDNIQVDVTDIDREREFKKSKPERRAFFRQLRNRGKRN